ncbi:MAG: hypothetical protein HQ512_05670 [Rhodospirillales bacterium]|nr:hypothetical protein [Rhodospirillales bacterium]
MKAYSGERTIDGIKVTVDGQPLDERYDIERFTTMGFEWTYEGTEPHQLALALLADHLGDDERARALSEPFMKLVVADLDNDWVLNSNDIDAALKRVSEPDG